MNPHNYPPAISLLEQQVSVVTAPYASAPLLLALSGGADSVALLRALTRCGRPVVAAHCNFHLRGEESNRDQRFVERLCRKLGVPLLVKHFDVDSYRDAHGGSMEMACRDLRYEWFRTVARERECARILTAHHRDDNIETMLLNMMRSCGLEAMGGMSTDNGEICRPLLSVSRKEITEYLEALGQPYITDSSNLTTDPDRNFLRLRVIPLLEERWPHATDALAAVQKHLAESALIYRKQIDTWLGQRPPGIMWPEMLQCAEAPATLLHEFLVAERIRIPGSVEQEILLACLNGKRWGQRWSVTDFDGKQKWVVREAGQLKICDPAEEAHTIEVTQQALTTELMETIKGNRSKNIAWFPRGEEAYCVRAWREGDYIYPMGMKGRRKVADLLKEGLVSRPLRSHYLLVAYPEPSSEVLWVPCLRRSRKELVDTSATTCFKFSAHW